MQKVDARSISSLAQEHLRQLAVKAVLDGKKQKEVAELFGITPQTVCIWVKAYRLQGQGALKSKEKGGPQGGKLLPWQAAQIAKTVIDHHPEQLKLPFYLWTREAVALLIKRRFGLKLSVWTIGRYLKRWGFTPQKPARRAWEQNPTPGSATAENHTPLFAARHRKRRPTYTGATNGAAVRPCRGTFLWSQRTDARNFGHWSALRLQHDFCHYQPGATKLHGFQRAFYCPGLLRVFWRLLRQSDRRIYLIIDNHPVHRSLKVKNWVKENEERLRLVFLPSYSPQINPDELLNQDVKSNAVGRQRPGNQTELMGKVRSYLRSRQCKPHIVANYFQGKHVQYAA